MAGKVLGSWIIIWGTLPKGSHSKSPTARGENGSHNQSLQATITHFLFRDTQSNSPPMYLIRKPLGMRAKRWE